jgi:aldose 1-epimerase
MRKRPFGRTAGGRAVEQVVLESPEAAVAILSLGAVVRDWRIDGPAGSLPMVLGFPTVEAYERHARSHGAICGRVANRIKDARFSLDGKEYLLAANEGPNQLHGGPEGLGGRVWAMEVDGPAVELRLTSPDGDQGFPGAVDFSVRYWLEGRKLVCEMRGHPDRPTPINLANHNYYNLGGSGTVKDHVLRVDAEEYTPTDDDLIPLGEIRPVEGTHLDFREPREIGDTRLDQNLVLRPGRDVAQPAAWAECPRTGVRLELWTAEPGLQLFDAPEMVIGTPGHDGQAYGAYAGLCLEAQHHPDSLHHPDWPSIVRTPEEPYFQRLEVAIGR